jgi:hypothetical protein
MYPSSISRALCSDGMRCIKPLAPSRNETNSSRVNGGAVGAILGICSYGGQQSKVVCLAALASSDCAMLQQNGTGSSKRSALIRISLDSH